MEESRGLGCLVRRLFRWVDIVEDGTPLVICRWAYARRILAHGRETPWENGPARFTVTEPPQA
jgi:hypothetical protein